jgi:hypothetical protein
MPLPLLRPLVGTLRVVCGLTLSEHLRCGELLHLDSGLQNGFITSVTFFSDP